MFLVLLFWAKNAVGATFLQQWGSERHRTICGIVAVLVGHRGLEQRVPGKGCASRGSCSGEFFSATKLMQGCKWLRSANSKHLLRSRDAHLKISRWELGWRCVDSSRQLEDNQIYASDSGRHCWLLGIIDVNKPDMTAIMSQDNLGVQASSTTLDSPFVIIRSTFASFCLSSDRVPVSSVKSYFQSKFCTWEHYTMLHAWSWNTWPLTGQKFKFLKEMLIKKKSGLITKQTKN